MPTFRVGLAGRLSFWGSAGCAKYAPGGATKKGPPKGERLAWCKRLAISVSHQGLEPSSIRGAWKSVPLKLSLRYPPYTHRQRTGRQLHAFAGRGACFFDVPLCLRRFPLDPHAGCFVRLCTRRHNRKTLVFPSSQPTRKDAHLANFPGESARAERV